MQTSGSFLILIGNKKSAIYGIANYVNYALEDYLRSGKLFRMQKPEATFTLFRGEAIWTPSSKLIWLPDKKVPTGLKLTKMAKMLGCNTGKAFQPGPTQMAASDHMAQYAQL